ncbi:MAG: FAD-binding oxidoreductase, partial [Deltaproteobacteria bacterium]|nr:FAD-binding oxidoreductase [Deltaproteobacteria bacterium]MBW2046583.1 FAD-binding oxidoreductase [Deltaproteobacteria bacterium]
SGICLLRLLIAESDGETTEAAARALEKMLQKSVEAGGNLVIQRAPASAKGKLRMWGELSPDFIVMRRLKEQLDTSGIMSPGRFVGGL